MMFRQICLWSVLIVIANCDNLLVNTKSGPIKGFAQETYVNKRPYISYKGIPYAQPPIGQLRFKEPIPVEPWNATLITTNEYKPSCLKLPSSPFFQVTGVNRSEDCLYLNVYTPVLEVVKKGRKLSVIFYIFGGGNTDGDGTNKLYGPDFIMENDTILVTFDFRLGPFGFANFNKYGYTGNMGFKDQREALKWVKNNIVYFGGDPNAITIMGQSSGASCVHLHILGSSCEYINRAIILSGYAMSYWVPYEKNNHLDLLRESFKDGLGDRNSDEDIFNFMMNASTDLIVQKTPIRGGHNGLMDAYWGAVIEDNNKAITPFLTQKPHKIYGANSLSSRCKDIKILFGITSAEFGISIDPSDLYSWIEQVKNHSLIGLPYHGLSLTSNDTEYKELQSEIFDYYFGDEEIEPTLERLNQYIQMRSDIGTVVPFYEAIKLHSKVSPTFCYHFNISLSTNIVKVPRQSNMIEGSAHGEEIGYIFKCEQFSDLYDQTMANQRHNVTSQQTINAWQFMSGLITDFAKFGSLGNVKPIKSINSAKCVDITNTGLNVAALPRRKEIEELWNKVRQRVQSKIVDEF